MKNPAIHAALVLNGFLLLLALLALCISATLSGVAQLATISLLILLVPFARGCWLRVLYRDASAGERHRNINDLKKSRQPIHK